MSLAHMYMSNGKSAGFFSSWRQSEPTSVETKAPVQFTAEELNLLSADPSKQTQEELIAESKNAIRHYLKEYEVCLTKHKNEPYPRDNCHAIRGKIAESQRNLRYYLEHKA